MTTSPVAEHDHLPTRLGGHHMHDISEDVCGESSGNEGEGPAEPVSSSSPRKIIQGLLISTGFSSLGLFATESGPIVPVLSHTLSMSSMTQQQPTPVPG
jgi:hypothetical protein